MSVEQVGKGGKQMSDKLQFVVVRHLACLPAEENDKLKFIGHLLASTQLVQTNHAHYQGDTDEQQSHAPHFRQRRYAW